MNCPRCDAQLEQDFGVVTCPSCSAVHFIDMDGNIQASEQSEELVAAVESDGPMPEVMPAEDFPETIIQDPVAFDVDLTANPLEQATDALENYEVSLDTLSGGSDEQTPRPSDFSDVLNFANSSKELPALSYDILIEDINTQEQRDALKKALTDSKFQWEVRDLIGKITKGTLEIKKLHPVKTSVLIYRLRGLPLKVSWRQNVFKA